MLLELIQQINKKGIKQVKKEIKRKAKKRSKEEGKSFGECDSCGEKTVLVEQVGLCGPCCFGEVDTFNGNW